MLTHLLFSFLVILPIVFGQPSVRFPEEVDPRPWSKGYFDETAKGDISISRLPTNVVPSFYRLNLRPILEDGPDQFTTPGDVTITVEALEATNSITFNARDIDINTD